jgi:hypothetical protein
MLPLIAIVPGYAGAGVTAVHAVPFPETSTSPPSYQVSGLPLTVPVQKSCQLQNVRFTLSPAHAERSIVGEISAARSHDV